MEPKEPRKRKRKIGLKLRNQLEGYQGEDNKSKPHPKGAEYLRIKLAVDRRLAGLEAAKTRKANKKD